VVLPHIWTFFDGICLMADCAALTGNDSVVVFRARRNGLGCGGMRRCAVSQRSGCSAEPSLWGEARKTATALQPGGRHRLPTAECLVARRRLSRSCRGIPKGTNQTPGWVCGRLRLCRCPKGAAASREGSGINASGGAEAKASGVKLQPLRLLLAHHPMTSAKPLFTSKSDSSTKLLFERKLLIR
jgi:hypothetical protein